MICILQFMHYLVLEIPIFKDICAAFTAHAAAKFPILPKLPLPLCLFRYRKQAATLTSENTKN